MIGTMNVTALIMEIRHIKAAVNWCQDAGRKATLVQMLKSLESELDRHGSV